MKRQSAIFYSCVSLCIIVISALMLQHPKDNVLSNQENAFDVFITHAEFLEFDKQGKMEIKITAEKTKHYNTFKTTFFTHPQALIYTKDHIPWIIAAKQGRSSDDGTKILLSHQVTINQLSQDNSNPVTIIETESLTLFPKTKKAISHDLITIHRKGIYIQGKGLAADFKTGRYQLISQSKGIYDPADKEHT